MTMIDDATASASIVDDDERPVRDGDGGGGARRGATDGGRREGRAYEGARDRRRGRPDESCYRHGY
jgi:hypothetical protein